MREALASRPFAPNLASQRWNSFTAPPSSACAAPAGRDGRRRPVTLGNIVVRPGAQGAPPVPRPGARRLCRQPPRTPSRSSSASRAGEASRATWCARRSSWRATGALTACCAGSKPCWRWPDRSTSLIITGNGDVLEPEHGIIAIGSGGAYAAAARALLHTEMAPPEVVKQSLEIAGDLCIYTNQNHTIRPRMSAGHDAAGDAPDLQARPPHRQPGRAKRACGDRAAQPLAAPAGRPVAAPRDHAEKNILMIGPPAWARPRSRAASRARRRALHQVGATKFTGSATSARTSTPSCATWPTAPSSRSARRDAAKVRTRAEDAAEGACSTCCCRARASSASDGSATAGFRTTRQVMRKRLREGALDDREIEIELAEPRRRTEIMGPAGMEDMASSSGACSPAWAAAKQTRKLRSPRRAAAGRGRAGKLVNDGEIKCRRRSPTPSRTASSSSTDRQGRSRGNAQGADVSRQGVQRPAAAGRGHHGQHQVRHGEDRPHPCSSPRARSTCQAQRPDPGAAGRFPIRVELGALSVDDFRPSSPATHASLVKQYQLLLATERDAGARARRRSAASRRSPSTSTRTENIGARRWPP